MLMYILRIFLKFCVHKKVGPSYNIILLLLLIIIEQHSAKSNFKTIVYSHVSNRISDRKRLEVCCRWESRKKKTKRTC